MLKDRHKRPNKYIYVNNPHYYFSNEKNKINSLKKVTSLSIDSSEQAITVLTLTSQRSSERHYQSKNCWKQACLIL